ncbi:InlB B-repeat-containing protein [Thermocrinis sp.]|uniref:DUF7948 domain-containing protein n=1 Tax=Thermocrinis sp. TaxID=2024383 RepID=UPI003C052749
MQKRLFLALLLIASLLSLVWLASSQSTASKSLTKAEPSTTPSVPSKEAVSAKLATLERGWVKNEGQWDERALFSAPGYFGTTWITKDGELLHVAIKGKESWVISERWVGGKVQTVKGEEELQTKVSYFIGNDPSKHKTNLPTYRYVSLGEVWSGIEVKLKATQKTVEKLFYVQPGADPSKIVVEVGGAKGLKLSKDGEIIIKTGLGELKLSKPVAWQEKDGKKLPVEVSYKLIGKNRYSFVVAKADPSLPLVIDPILQSTYLGGGYDDYASALAIHPQTGEVYVAGATFSDDFPKTTGGAQKKCNNCSIDLENPSYDAFVARLNKELTQILQSTYLGGSDSDSAYALVIHPQTGDVYVAGWTLSTDFPKTTGGARRSYGGKGDAFVARLNKELTQILQSTYLGGKKEDYAHALVIHPQTGEVYVAGKTESTDFPKTAGGAQGSYGGGKGDAFVARLNKELTQILQSTYLGGRGEDEAKALTIHLQTSEVYVTGITNSKDFPKTTNGAQTTCNGCVSGSFPSYDAFVARLNKDLTQILQATYLGGSETDSAKAIAIHPKTGEVYVAGDTYSTKFPKTAGGAQVSLNGSRDAFVARLNKELTQILQSTYLGGSSGWETADALVIHPRTGEVYVAGWTISDDFPKTTGGAQTECNGCYIGRIDIIGDAFVARLTINLTAGNILSISPKPTNGNVASSPAGINCGSGGSMCSADFYGTVTLTATPSTGYTFAGWTGDCSVCGTSTTCTITMDANKSCSANFTASGRGTGRGGIGVGCSMTGSASSPAGFWNILVWLSVPVFALARRIRRK